MQQNAVWEVLGIPLPTVPYLKFFFSRNVNHHLEIFIFLESYFSTFFLNFSSRFIWISKIWETLFVWAFVRLPFVLCFVPFFGGLCEVPSGIFSFSLPLQVQALKDVNMDCFMGFVFCYLIRYLVPTLHCLQNTGKAKFTLAYSIL